METNNTHIGEATTIGKIKERFSILKAITASKHVRKVTLLVSIPFMAIFLIGSTFGKEDPRTQLKNAYMELGAITFEQKEVEQKAASIRKTQIEPLQARHNDLTTRRTQIETKINELESFTKAGTEQK